MCRVPAATLPGPGRTIVVEPLEVPREAPEPAPRPEPVREPVPAAPSRDPDAPAEAAVPR
jgi:hypothetical protein